MTPEKTSFTEDPALEAQLSGLSEQEIDQLEQELTAKIDASPAPEPEPIVKPDPKEVYKGLSPLDQLEIEKHPERTGDFFDRHSEFANRVAGGENALETRDYPLWRWQTQIEKHDRSLLGTFAAALTSIPKHLTQFGAENLAGAAEAVRDHPQRTLLMEALLGPLAPFVSSARGRDTNLVSAAKVGSNAATLVRSLPVWADKAGTAVAKLFSDDATAAVLDELHAQKAFAAEVKNYDDAKTAENFHKEVTAAIPALEGIVGTTEVNQEATEGGALLMDPANWLPGVAAARVARAPVQAVFAGELRSAVEHVAGLRRQVAALEATTETAANAPVVLGKPELLVSAKDTAELAGKIAALRGEIGLGEQTVAAEQARQAARLEQLTQAARSRVAAGKALGAVGEIAERVGGVLDAVNELPAALARKIAPESEAAQKIIARSAPAAVGAAVGYAAGDEQGAAVGAGLGLLGASSFVRVGGRDLRRLGETFAAGEATLPYWRNVRMARDISGFTKQAAAFMDSSVFAPARAAGALGAGAVRGATAAGAVGGAFGALGDPEDPAAGAARGAGAGAFFGAAVGSFGQWRRYANPAQIMRERAAQTRLYKDILKARPDEAKVFDRLPRTDQDRVANYLVAHPDAQVRYINDPRRSAGEFAREDPEFITVNLASKDPIHEVVGHELAHFVEQWDLGDTVDRLVLGDADAGIPGNYVARDESGNPIVDTDDAGKKTFRMNAEFEALRQKYLDKIDDNAAQKNWTPEKLAAEKARMDDSYIAREIFAEQHLSYLDSKDYNAALKGNDFLFNHAALKTILGNLGFVFDRDGGVVRSSLFGDMRKSKAISTLLDTYYRGRVKGRSGEDREAVGDQLKIDEVALSRKTGYAEKYFDAAGEILRDAAGNPVYDANGKVQLRGSAEINRDLRATSAALIEALDAQALSARAVDPDAVQRRIVDGQTFYSGRYLTDETLAAVEQRGKLNPVQLDNLRQLNAELKAEPGRAWTHFYQAATRKGFGSKYRSLAGRWRTDLAYGFRISKGENVLVQSVSLETLQKNAAQAVAQERAGLWNNELGKLNGDIRTYLDNLAHSRPGETGLGDRAIDKKNFINNLLGLRVKKVGDVNPLFETTNPPKTIITSLRLDRMNRVLPLADRTVPFTAEAYRRATMNLRPEVGPENAVDSAPSPVQMPGDERRNGRGVVYADGLVAGEGATVQLRPDAVTGRPQKDGKRLAHATKEKELILVHYSGQPALKEVSPKFIGRGSATPNDRRGLDSSFYFVEGSPMGGDRDLINSSGKSIYAARVSGARIYDANKDAAGYWDQINRWKADQKLRDAGYVGYRMKTDDRRDVVVLFEPLKVARVGQVEKPATKAKLPVKPAVKSALRERGDDPQFRPDVNEDTQRVARDYVERTLGRSYDAHSDYSALPEGRIRKIADYFDTEAKHDPDSPEVRDSYAALIRETKAQYDAMVEAGIKIEPFTGDGEPYKSSADMMKDVRDNRHLFFLLTDRNFGSGDGVSKHPMLDPSGIKIGGRELLNNDLFRAVHDYFGHTQQGFQFGPRGEFNAWKSHSRMFSPEAQGALAAETLAQNAWVNFGPHLRDAGGKVAQKGEPGFVAPQDRPFADQRAFVLPEELRAQLRPDTTYSWMDPSGKTFPVDKNHGVDAQRRFGTPTASGATELAWRRGWVRVTNAGDELYAHTESGFPSAKQVAELKNIAIENGKARLVLDTGEDRRVLWSDSDDTGPQLRPSVAKQIESPEFKKWFGDSKAVDDNGLPLVLYHGTLGNFDQFKRHSYFTPDPEVAAAYGGSYLGGGTLPRSAIYPVFIQAQHPLTVRSMEELRNTVPAVKVMDATDKVFSLFQALDSSEVRKAIAESGYDSVHFTDASPDTNEPHDAWLVFDPEQVKSATGNRGTFDPKNPDIRYRPEEDNHTNEGSPEPGASAKTDPMITGTSAPEAFIFVSPNTGNLDFPGATKAVAEDAHRKFATKARSVAKGAIVADAIGDWVDGAENALTIAYDHPVDTDTVKKVSAQLGLEGQQKAVLYAVRDNNGPATIYELNFPRATIEQVREELSRAGITFRTLVRRGSGVSAFVVDLDSSLHKQVMDVIRGPLAPAVKATRARGEFIGNDTDREAGAAEFRRILRELGGVGGKDAGDGSGTTKG